MRVRLQVLLRAVYARIYGAGRRRIREKDFREAKRRGASGAGSIAEVFVPTAGGGGWAPGAYRDRHGYGPVSAGGTGIWRYAGLPGGIGEARGVERFRDHQV